MNAAVLSGVTATTRLAAAEEGPLRRRSFAKAKSSDALPRRWRPAATWMEAAVITAPRAAEIREVRVPEPNPDQMLIKLEGCGVCASNIPPWEGRPWFKYPFAPGQLGHEGWGRIVRVGKHVSGFSVGDRVAFISNHAYAEYDLGEPSSTALLPGALDRDPFPGEPLGCALNIFHRSCIDVEDFVAIVGVGFLGALLVQLATASGARVIAIARRPFAVEVAKKMGAARSIVMDDPSQIVANVKEFTGGDFCDVVIEATGKQGPLDVAAELTRERGRLVIGGYHQDGLRQVNMQLWNWRGIDVINAHERDPLIYRSGIRDAISAVEDHLLNPAQLYTHRFPLNQLHDALNMAAERPEGFMKALITMP